MPRITLVLDVDPLPWAPGLSGGEVLTIARESLRQATRTAAGLASLWDSPFEVQPVRYEVDGVPTLMDDPPF